MEDYVDFETAQMLKRAGFDLKCAGYYYIPQKRFSDVYPTQNYNESFKYISAPTLAQAQKWIRETKGIAINVVAHDGGYYMWDVTFLPNAPEYKTPIHLDFRQYNTYESALNVGIKAVLGMITSNTDKE